MIKATKDKVISSLLWKFMECGGTQAINFLVSIVLARLLLPKEYGLIALISVFISLANVFVQNGFNTALIQKKDADELDFSTVFYISLLIAILLYIVLFFSSPYIARFYQVEQLIPILRVLSITLFFGAVNSIQIAIISRNMQFKKLFYRSIIAMITSGVVGIVMAYQGFGVWALVGQQLTNQIISTIVMWVTVRWRPKFLFSLERLRKLLSFGWKILVSNLINTLFLNLRDLIIGKTYNPDMLGFFNRGRQFPAIIITTIDGSIQSVMLPAYSSEQDNKNRVKEMVRRSITISSFIVFPLMIGLAIVAEPLVRIVLTDKWLPCVPFLQIFCATYMLLPIHTANLQAIQALGCSGILLKLEIVRKVLELAILLVSIKYGVYAIALGTLLASIISIIINSYPNRKLLEYSYREQIKDIIPSFILSIIMGAGIYWIQFIGLTGWATLLIQIIAGFGLYIILAYIFKIGSFTYLINSINDIYKNRRCKIVNEQ